MSIIEINGLNQGYGDTALFDGASMRVNRGEHIGLVGLNGAGKTTLMRIILGEVIPDNGTVNINRKLKIGYLDQNVSADSTITIDQYLREAFRDLYLLDGQMQSIYENMAVESTKEQIKSMERAENMRVLLDVRGFELIDKKIRNVSGGLGIDAYGVNTPMRELSGGQRARVILAKLLLENNDIMLLDEPTNFLDAAFVEWLAGYLCTYKGAFVVISHDAEFLSRVSSLIFSVENKKIVRYVGNYDSYLIQRQKRDGEYSRQYASQQKFIKVTEDFIKKNITRAATSGRAKSRMKMLNKIDKIDKPLISKEPVFKFTWAGSMYKEMLDACELEIGYSEPLLPMFGLKVEKGEKCIIKGFNGIGKTTLLKTLAAELEPLGGRIITADNAVSIFFRQEETSESITPIDYIGRYYPLMTRRDIMAKLSLCGVGQDMMMRSMLTLSGGERTKVRLCQLTMVPADILMMDEPTNHLDTDSKQGLLKGLRDFAGSVIITSHDLNFDVSWADRVIDLELLFD